MNELFDTKRAVLYTGIGCLVLVTRLLWKRLVSHPLASFPGPKLAAATQWYSTYYEVWKDGGMVEKLEELHRVYGPVVRFSPYELHFADPSAYVDIYTNGGTRFTKDPRLYMVMHEDQSSLCFIDPREAKTRRDIIAPMFSRKSILQLEQTVTAKVNALVRKVLIYEATGEPVDMHRAYRSATLDIILNYCFAREYGVIDTPDFRHFLILAYEQSFPMILVLKQFPWSFYLFIMLGKLVGFLTGAPTMETVFSEMAATIEKLVARPELLENEAHDTIYHHLLRLHPEKGQTEIPSAKSLQEEAVNLVAAGSDTVGNAATVGTFYILRDAEVKARLRAELEDAWPDLDLDLGYEALERLPYLTAVIKESLRLSHGVVYPAPRIVGTQEAVIAGHVVPKGTSVAIGSTFMHLNPRLFPDPLAFQPERWLQADSRELEQYLVPFSKGPRACLGQNLAWCEMYLIFGHMFRKVDMVLHDTTIADMAFRCHFTPTFRGKHVHCTVKARK